VCAVLVGNEGVFVSEWIIQTHALTRDFGSLRAVDHVDLKVRSGSIHAIITVQSDQWISETNKWPGSVS